jgi:hypothetical protein
MNPTLEGIICILVKYLYPYESGWCWECKGKCFKEISDGTLKKWSQQKN